MGDRILLENGTGDPNLFPQCLSEGQWQDRDAVLAAFTFAYQHFPALQVDVLDTQLHTLEKTHARTIEYSRHQLIDTAHLLQDELDLGLRQHNWSFGAG